MWTPHEETSMHALEGEVTPKEFVIFLKEQLPKFYEYSLDAEYPFITVYTQLHEASFCNERCPDGKDVDIDLDSRELHQYLHSLMQSCKLYRNRIEIIYSQLI
jgi:hypothetical protein